MPRASRKLMISSEVSLYRIGQPYSSNHFQTEEKIESGKRCTCPSTIGGKPSGTRSPSGSFKNGSGLSSNPEPPLDPNLLFCFNGSEGELSMLLQRQRPPAKRVSWISGQKPERQKHILASINAVVICLRRIWKQPSIYCQILNQDRYGEALIISFVSVKSKYSNPKLTIKGFLNHLNKKIKHIMNSAFSNSLFSL